MRSSFLSLLLCLSATITLVRAEDNPPSNSPAERASKAISPEKRLPSESLDQWLKRFLEASGPDKLHPSIGAGLNPQDSDLEKEIFAALERDSPRELHAALKSAGNIHNPKVRQLYPAFQKAVLATPTVAKVNAVLAPYHLHVSGTEIEELGIIRTSDSRPQFICSLSLDLAKAP